MKVLIKQIFLMAALIGVLSSCDQGESIQKYYVEKQNNNNFISVDLPASLIQINDSVSVETKETLKTINKLNLLAFKLEDSNKNEYVTEVQKVKEILKNKTYNDLIRLKHENTNVVIKFLGDENAVDEFILFASNKEKGFALARVLGKNMHPDKLAKLAKDIKELSNDENMSQIKGLLKEFDVE